MNIRIQHQRYALPLIAGWPGRRQGGLRVREGWIVKVAGEHFHGLGDCAPLPGSGTESAHQARGLLETWARKTFPDKDSLLEEAGRYRSDFPAASHALECAALDLLAQEAGQALRQILSPAARSGIETNSLAGTACQSEVDTAAQDGFRIVKIKAGHHDMEEELHCLQRLCRQLPTGMGLRLDANGAWDYDTARRFLDGLKDLPVESLEEPLRGGSLEDLSRLQEHTPLPLALDESLKYMRFQDVLDSTIRQLVLKPVVVGGLRHSFNLAGQIRESGKNCVVTTVLESAIGVHATCQLAAAVNSLIPGMIHGLATSSWLQKDVASAPVIEAGCIHLTSTPGIGIHPHERLSLPVQGSFS